jgi:hypothetical protein
MAGLPLTLVYDAPVECPAQDSLRGAVENLVAGQQSRPFSARVMITKVGNSYQATLTSEGGSARVLSGSTCAEVVEGISVVLALAISPKGVTAEQAKPSEAPAGEAARHNSAAAGRVTRWVAGATARGDAGTLPQATLGFGGQLGLEGHRWSAYAAGTYWLNARATLPSDPTLGGEFSWWTGAAVGCGAPVVGAVRVDVCGGAELGRLSGLGFGALSRQEHPVTAWGALTASLGARWAISGGFRLQGGLGLAVPFLGRRPFELGGARVYEPGVVAARAEVGPEIVF